MGNSQGAVRTNFLVIIYKDFDSAVGLKEVLGQARNLQFEAFQSVERVFESLRQDQLANILTSDQQKREVIDYMVRHHLTSTRLYVLTRSGDISQEDYDNVYITSISNDIRKLLSHLQSNTQTELYMPLLKLNRALQKKINIKLIYPEENQAELRKLTSKMEELHLSYELYPSISTFEDSVMVSVSDYIISCTEHLRGVCEIVKKKFKNANVIHYETSGTSLSNPNREIVMGSEKDFRKILEEIVRNSNKIGSRIEPIQKLFVYRKHTVSANDPNEQQMNGLVEKIVEFNERSTPKIQLLFFDDLQELVQATKAQPSHSAVLFLRGKSNEVNYFKQILIDEHMSYRVLVIVLRSDSYKDKLEEYAELSKYFHIQKRVVRTVDWINRSIHEKFFDVHKRQLLINNIRTVEYTSLEQYKRAINSQHYSPSYYVLCTASAVEQLQEYLKSYKKQQERSGGGYPHIICFDSRENVHIVRQKRLFIKSDIFWIANSNMKEIIECMKKQPHEYLVTDNVRTKKQMQAYSEVRQTFLELKSSFFRLETSPFSTTEYENIYREEPSFMRFDGQAGEDARISLFLQRFVKLWVMRYNPVRDFEMLKEDLMKSLMLCLRCKVLRVKDRDFDEQYSKKVQACTNLCQLARTCVYIYSLPHGLSEILNRLLSEFEDNIRLLRVMCPFMFCLLLNFCNFFERRSMEQRKLKIYVNGDMKESQLPTGSIIYNTNFFNCINVDQYSPSDKNYIEVSYENMPLKEKNFLCGLMFIEPYSFYKEAVEYIFAPYNRFVVKGFKKIGGANVMQLQCQQNTDIIRLFLEQIIDTKNLLQTFKQATEDGSANLVSREERQEKMAAVHYQQFLNATKRGLLLTADHNLHLYRQCEIKDLNSRAVSEVDRAWLLTLQGEYSLARSVLAKIPSSIDSFVLEQVKRVEAVISETCERRAVILDSISNRKCWEVRYNSKPPAGEPSYCLKPKPIKWNCRYLHEEEEFTMRKEGTRLEHMYERERLTFGEQSLFFIYLEQPKVYLEFDAEQKRALQSTLQLARNQLEGEAYAANALILGGFLASDKAGVSILDDDQAETLQNKAKNMNLMRLPSLQGTALNQKRVSGTQIIDDILKGQHDHELQSQSLNVASIAVLQQPASPPLHRVVEVAEQEHSVTVKWFCMYINGAFKMVRQNSKKRPRVKKLKQKSFMFLT